MIGGRPVHFYHVLDDASFWCPNQGAPSQTSPFSARSLNLNRKRIQRRFIWAHSLVRAILALLRFVSGRALQYENKANFSELLHVK
ncbi:hypothetical protein ACTXT7_011881, partial [Hymenolepis weldensis]